MKLSYIIAALLLVLASCSHEETYVRTPDDILGVWSPGENTYLEIGKDNVVRNLQIYEQDGETIGKWNDEVYFYEPGYNLVIYLTYENTAAVYQIIEMTEKAMTWCWVEDIKASTIQEEGIGNVIGSLINKAQEGFKLDPEHYQTLQRIPENEFYQLLESLDLMYPW